LSGALPWQAELPPRRVILLAASNLVRGLPIVVESARRSWLGPLDILAAIGHGRSYGMESRVLGRALPGILQCGLWEALAARPPAPTAALLTDIGNDILYGASAAQIARWVETCLARLRPVSERLIVTQLPLASIAKLGTIRFTIVRTILFPQSRLQLAAAVSIARELNDRVVELADRYSASVAEPDPQWYGLDPIHIRRRLQPAAWKNILSGWSQKSFSGLAQRSLLQTWKLRLLRPQTRRLFGIEQRLAQPCGKLNDGSLLSLY